MKCKRRGEEKKKGELWGAWVVVTKDNAEFSFLGIWFKSKSRKVSVLTKK